MAFIARAKQLGCTLEEIADLVEVWNGDRCGPVQRRLHDLVTWKLRDADAQITELKLFAAQLRAAADQLAGEPIDGPCGDDFACLQAPDTEVSIACTLGAGEVSDRLAAWDRIKACATSRRLRLPSGGVRLEFEPGVDIGELAALVVAEQTCCAFFQFAVTVDGRGVGLEVDAPAEAMDLVAGLFGMPS